MQDNIPYLTLEIAAFCADAQDRIGTPPPLENDAETLGGVLLQGSIGGK
jgi:hypothetical protein